jgi:hypothetical protein
MTSFTRRRRGRAASDGRVGDGAASASRASAVRGIFTFVGVAAAGFLIWLSTQFGQGLGSYWAKIGLLAAAGLALPVSQLFGGWTKWGLPRFSGYVVLLGFLPALIVAGWVILSGQPDDNWFQRHTTSWSGDLHVARLVRHLRETYLDVLAFGLGSVFGFSFDTTGPRARLVPDTQPPVRAAAPRREETAVTRVDETSSEAETRINPPENPPTES